MATAVLADFGGLSLGETETFNGALNLNRPLSGAMFRTGPVNATVSISSAPRGNPTVQGADVDISLFQDTNNDGVLDTNKDARIATGSGRESDESISLRLSQGTYFIGVQSITPSFIPFSLRFSRANTGANPLTSPEIQIGQISQDLRRSNRVNDNDTADNYAFTLDGSSSLDINVRELGNKKGDVNIRVVQDRNGNGVVNRGDVVVQGINPNNSNGNIDTNIDIISGFKGAGNYILQVCQNNGDTKFAVKFDHSVV